MKNTIIDYNSMTYFVCDVVEKCNRQSSLGQDQGPDLTTGPDMVGTIFAQKRPYSFHPRSIFVQILLTC